MTHIPFNRRAITLAAAGTAAILKICDLTLKKICDLTLNKICDLTLGPQSLHDNAHRPHGPLRESFYDEPEGLDLSRHGQEGYIWEA